MSGFEKRRSTRAALLLLGAAVFGCLPPLQGPPLGPQEQLDPIPVPFPPPPARVDVVPDAPSEMKSPAWVDGQWLWRGRRWVWEPGEWVAITPGQVYANPRIVRRSDGQLVWFQGAFQRRPSPTPIVSASSSASVSP